VEPYVLPAGSLHAARAGGQHDSGELGPDVLRPIETATSAAPGAAARSPSASGGEDATCTSISIGVSISIDIPIPVCIFERTSGACRDWCRFPRDPTGFESSRVLFFIFIF
jgi:hypothetical protein